MKASMSPADIQRGRLLAAILPHVPFDGFSKKSFHQACRDMGMPEQQAAQLCPQGAASLARLFLSDGDARLEEALKNMNFGALRVRERIIQGVRLRLELDEPNREIVARAMWVLALPANLNLGLRALHQTVDVIWRAAGDETSDFNYYSKRAILAGIFSVTLMRWLSDKQGSHGATWAFLEKRIEDVMHFEKAKAKMRHSFARAPNFLASLSRLRFGRDASGLRDKDA